MKIKVRVTPQSRKEHFKQAGEFLFEVAVKQRAVKNGVNARVQELIAEHFNVPVTSVRFITGLRSRTKILDVIG